MRLFGRDRIDELVRLIVDQRRLDVVRVFPRRIPYPTGPPPNSCCAESTRHAPGTWRRERTGSA
jgi:hypothetical protein